MGPWSFLFRHSGTTLAPLSESCGSQRPKTDGRFVSQAILRREVGHRHACRLDELLGILAIACFRYIPRGTMRNPFSPALLTRAL